MVAAGEGEVDEPGLEPARILEAPGDVAAVDGAGARFECRVAGRPRPDVYWLRHTTLITPGEDFTIRVGRYFA